MSMQLKRSCRLLVVVSCLLATSLAAQEPVRAPRTKVDVAVGSGAVASESAHATRVGHAVLRQGGNAVDAAVSVAFALAVTWPEAGNIGGGGFMMVLPKPGEPPVCVEYRERAPAAAHAKMFRIDDSRFSWKIVGVPGTVRGMELAHKRFGSLPWKQLVQPAVVLAEQGFVVDVHLAGSLNSILSKTASESKEFAAIRQSYGHPEGRPWKAGDRLKLPALAKSLARIAEDPNAFYVGPMAEQLAAAMSAGDGLITVEDLANYQAKIRKTVRGEYRGYEVWGAPPPSSGGTCLIEALNMLKTFDLRQQPTFSVRNVHLRAEAMRRAFLDRARHLGDPDFVSIPPHLVDPAYGARLARSISQDAATPSESLAPEIRLAPESPNTTHFSVADRNGMMVSNTYTLEASWGARRLVPSLGYVLNNEMGDFNWTPGRTDRLGRIGTAANVIAPGKRMLSSQTPTLVTKDGKGAFAIGSPGGRTIINTVLGITVDVLEHKTPLPDAVAAPRLHHQWFPDVLRFEGVRDPKYRSLVDALKAKGHKLEGRRQGSAHCIAILPDGRVQAVADFRRGGSAMAVSGK